ncbi:D-alanyl-D-alanine carboxypeptidase family protein [Lactobacillus mulieris]|uniref:D-alanyl-D-alanine carboxypeptidase n=1 Tax=Lactobacillus mulieris TaxID=2508708 RepID=A0AAP3GVM7_9LACO|nr:MULTISPECIES: D-alanyl-D-alanine carboxypeptidase family protein [Lactobacillus]EEX24342.1 serine-type D-Ala-D-Ala carboxypeptidase [Lactobacillus jensenii 115-3-CHN]EFH29511.1 serine-type D-Ala-D-Ala carboxypeptidase [Lactobacillus jensenii JV-V16]KAA9244493.1 D-alanyl-D-alanine carboxypeptidase [Lactobacillus jensenii]KAA9370352.1 D-alanyl-D-alanine carboxypeptidase [Lactobacillus jensenii]KAA9371757.1 D-alanyl-D-alanine carboxypeptidase [Lactobacillus jensenii]
MIMRRFRDKLKIAWLVALCIIGIINLTFFNVVKADEKPVNVKAAFMMDEKTGQILYQKNATRKYAVASLTKILTLAVIMEDIHKHKLDWDQEIQISKDVAKVADDWRFSNVPLIYNERYTVRSLIESMMIVSADGSTEALALADAGSVAAFNYKMKVVAKRAGVKNPEIYNMIGLSNGELGNLKLPKIDDNQENQFSAKDMALISKYLIDKYPEVLNITKTKYANFKISQDNEIKMENIIYMLEGMGYGPKKGTMDGLKTGKTDAAGYCYVGTGTFDNRRVITVVLDVPGEYSNQFIQTNNMIDTVFDKYQLVKINKNNLPKKYQKITITSKKQKKKISVVPETDSALWLAKDQKLANLSPKLEVKKQNKLKKGSIVASLIYKLDNHSSVKINLQKK